MVYRCRVRHSQLAQMLLCLWILLVSFNLSSRLVSAQANVGSEFQLLGFSSASILCTANSSMTPVRPNMTQAMCLTPAPWTNLTDLGEIAGQCRYLNQVQFSSTFSFSTMFSFTTLSFPQFTVGEGFVFFISDKPITASPPDATGGYLGWLDPSTTNQTAGHNFAVEFDLVKETTDGFDDPDNHHVGINLNSLDSIKTYSLADQQSLTSFSTDAKLYVWIDYDGKTIDVRLNQKPNKPCKTILSTPLDLSLHFLPKMYLGFSSSTGGANGDNTQTTIWDWSFNTNGEAVNIYGGSEYCGFQLTHLQVTYIIIGLLILIVSLMLSTILFLRLRMKSISDLELEKALLVAELKELDYGAREFSYQEILEATRDFKEQIGNGGFGTVYKGRIANLKANTKGAETLLAVKRIKRTSDSVEDAKQLVAEVKVIGRLRHTNIVPVLGWCYERGEMLLVYRYIENGDLDKLLFPKSYGMPDEDVLSWPTRMRILRGVAAALVFLHEEFECEQRVVHRDVKTRNVMIDRTFNARLGDFGLARLYDRTSSESHFSGVLIGTRGYMAPEYLEMGATPSTDVYSFGVLALVVATGRTPLDSTIPGRIGLVNWVRGMYDEGRIVEARDIRLMSKDTGCNLEEMERVLRMGLYCCVHVPESRPSMREVHTALQHCSPIMSCPLPPQNPEQVDFFDNDFSAEDNDSSTLIKFSSDFSKSDFAPWPSIKVE